MITQADKNQIRALLMSPEWLVVSSVAEDIKQQIRLDPGKRDTEWETASKAVYDDGQIAGIDRLFNELLNTQK